MADNVVVVESPAKCKTIHRYLGNDYTILASYGHVRDLLAKTGAVKPDENFQMTYVPVEQNEKHVSAIVKALKGASTLYLATDPDREGEAISWHLYEMLNEKGVLANIDVKRITFNEITKTAVQEAIQHPRTLSDDLVDAQQARRGLDHLVGFTLSPLLWKKVRRGLSAGRVQSPALRMIVEREIEIEAFESQEYWTIEADCAKEQKSFAAKCTHYEQNKLQQFDINNADQAEVAKAAMLEASGGILKVVKVEKKQRKRNPTAPFITSTLQQEAARKLGFSARKTMQVAQALYEGVDVGEGQTGLITYMRTDSVALSNDAIADIREFITKTYGEEDCPDSPRMFKSKSKNAQEAHEAIRPTSVSRTPDSIRGKLNQDQMKLYRLIWQRAVASQMAHAVFDTVGIDLACGDVATFRATGSVIVKPGFMRLYIEGRDDEKVNEDEDKHLPDLKEGDEVNLLAIRAEQHFTEPPPRYSEASLVKSLEEHGIGRPSTYASIIATLLAREYVILDSKRFMPTDVGRVVHKFLTEYFTRYVDYDFTAQLEDHLDEVSLGKKGYIDLLREFWSPFVKQIEHIDETVNRQDVTQEKLDEECPKCSQPLSIRLGRRGRFIGCTGYPDCDYTRTMDDKDGEEAVEVEKVEGRQCPECESDLVIKPGKYGKFIGCSGYPKCRFMEPLNKPKETGVSCPECKEGSLLERKSRYGKLFYSCNTYPKCKYAVWNPPVAEPCPTCHWPLLTIKTTKRRGVEKVCPQKECDYALQIEAPPEKPKKK